MEKEVSISRAEKLILILLELSKKEKSVKFEDIVVAAFKRFPDDFHLKGYKEYPDSGDLVHKPLYDFRKKGFVEANNKIFSLTDRGFDLATRLSQSMKGKKIESKERLSRFSEKEIERIISTEGFELFMKGEKDRINETDFYTYLSITPRTSKNDFWGRINTLNEAVVELKSKKNLTETESSLINYHSFLLEDKFKKLVEYFK